LFLNFFLLSFAVRKGIALKTIFNMKKNATSIPQVVIICAKILMSGIGIVDIRGKIQGTVMSKNKSGATARVKVTPVNPQTAYQQAVRVAFGAFSSAFRALTASQVNAWNSTAASGFKTNNIFGNPVSGSGLNLFNKLNTNLTSVGVASISDPPISEAVESPLVLDPAGLAGAATLFANAQFDGPTDVVPANTALVVYATPPVSNGVTFVKSLFRKIDFLDAAEDTGTTNLESAYSARFGVLVAGQKIFLKTVAVNKTTGQAGPPLIQSFVVGA
jgi:hypothetical protein